MGLVFMQIELFFSNIHNLLKKKQKNTIIYLAK